MDENIRMALDIAQSISTQIDAGQVSGTVQYPTPQERLITRQRDAIRRVLDLDVEGVIALPPHDLDMLLSLMPEDYDANSQGIGSG